jgi:adenylate kinase family enzyme
MIFGRPGSGKTTLAVALSRVLLMPVHHLDKYFFVDNWVERDKAEFIEIQQQLLNQDQWIIDGNATRSLHMRYQKADIVIYMVYPRFTCIWRVMKRFFTKDYSIDDRAPNCKEGISLKLLRYLWGFDKRVAEKIASLRDAYPDVKFYKITNDEELKQVWCKLTSSEEYVIQSKDINKSKAKKSNFIQKLSPLDTVINS